MKTKSNACVAAVAIMIAAATGPPSPPVDPSDPGCFCAEVNGFCECSGGEHPNCACGGAGACGCGEFRPIPGPLDPNRETPDLTGGAACCRAVEG